MPRRMCAWWPTTTSAPASSAASASGRSYGASLAGVCTMPLCSATTTQLRVCARAAAMSARSCSSASGATPPAARWASPAAVGGLHAQVIAAGAIGDRPGGLRPHAVVAQHGNAPAAPRRCSAGARAAARFAPAPVCAMPSRSSSFDRVGDALRRRSRRCGCPPASRSRKPARASASRFSGRRAGRRHIAGHFGAAPGVRHLQVRRWPGRPPAPPARCPTASDRRPARPAPGRR